MLDKWIAFFTSRQIVLSIVVAVGAILKQKYNIEFDAETATGVIISIVGAYAYLIKRDHDEHVERMATIDGNLLADSGKKSKVNK